ELLPLQRVEDVAHHFSADHLPAAELRVPEDLLLAARHILVAMHALRSKLPRQVVVAIKAATVVGADEPDVEVRDHLVDLGQLRTGVDGLAGEAVDVEDAEALVHVRAEREHRVRVLSSTPVDASEDGLPGT